MKKSNTLKKDQNKNSKKNALKETEYMQVKRSLETLGFRDNFTMDSLDLVKRVLDCLIKATKSFKLIKSENEKLQEEMRLNSNIVLPLRNENYKLIQDNNELHKSLLDLKEKLNVKKEEKHFITQNTNLNTNSNINSNNYYPIIINQKDTKIKNLEIEIDSLKTKLNEVFDKTYMYNGEEYASERGIAGTRKFLNYKNGYIPEMGPLIKEEYILSNPLHEDKKDEGIDLDKMLNEFKENINNCANVENENNNLIMDFEKNNEELKNYKNQINELKENINSKNQEIEELKKNLNIREEEIARLQKHTFIGDDNLQEIKIRYNMDFYKTQNEKLKRQNEFLNNENHRLTASGWFNSGNRYRDEQISKLYSENEVLRLQNTKYKRKKAGSSYSKERKFIPKKNEDSDILEIEQKIEIGKYKSIIKDLNKDNEDIRGRLLQLSKDNVNYKNQIKLLMDENNYLKNNNIKNLNTLDNFQANTNNNMANNEQFTKTMVYSNNNNQVNSGSNMSNEKEGVSAGN